MDEDIDHRRPFLTGSRIYGTPKDTSDVDLVVMVDIDTIGMLLEFFDANAKVYDDDEDREHCKPKTASLKCGALNLICVSDDIDYDIWKSGTEYLKRQSVDVGPVTRDEAIRVFKDMKSMLEALK